nr:unnamed protein product [Callosobruchus analis]
MMFLAMGFVYSYIVGPHFSTRVYTLLCTVPIMLALILILLVVPETPYFLVAKKRPRHEVAEVLGKLRSSTDLAEELKQIEDTVTRKSNSVIHGFLAPILDSVTGAYISGNTSAICISLVKLFSTAIGSIAVERYGRKPLLIWSAVSVAFCNFLLGLYFQLQELEYDFVSALSPLPLVCFVLFAVVYSLGIGPVPFAYLSEFFPQHAKNLGVPLCTAIGALVNALTVFGFPYFMDYFGMQWCFWLFAVSCICCALFTKYIVPETKGKTLEEIQRILEK